MRPTVPTGEPQTRNVRCECATAFVLAMLRRRGVKEQHARIVAACLVRADLRGVHSHGIARLPVYLERLERGMVNPSPSLAVERRTAAAAALDGDNGLGFVVAHKAMEVAMDLAADCGVGLVAARHSNHFGMAANYLLQAVEAGYIAVVCSNASRSMPPWGGRAALLGTNPWAMAAPSGTQVPFVFDMSPAVAARGKIRQAERRGQAIPPGYALDAEGRPTTDPAEAMKGVVLPLGGHKGSGIAMMIDILAGVFAGAGFAGEVHDQYREWDRPQNVGHFLMAMKPGLFIPEDAFRQRMDVLAGRVHHAPRADGVDEIVLPGELEARLEGERRRSGIPYPARDLEALDKAADAAGVERIAFEPSPGG